MMKSIFSNICPCSSVSLVVPGVDPQQLKLFASLINHQNYDPEQYHQSNDDNLLDLLQLLGINTFSSATKHYQSDENLSTDTEIEKNIPVENSSSKDNGERSLEQEFRKLNLEKVSKSSLSLCVTNNSDADIFLTDDESFFETPQTSKSNLAPIGIQNHTNSSKANINETVFEECQESFSNDMEDRESNDEATNSHEDLSCSTIEAEKEEVRETTLDNVEDVSPTVKTKDETSLDDQEDNLKSNVEDDSHRRTR